jgi:hypothetical protein
LNGNNDSLGQDIGAHLLQSPITAAKQPLESHSHRYIMAETDVKRLAGSEKEEIAEEKEKEARSDSSAGSGGLKESEVLQPEKPERKTDDLPKSTLPSRPHPSVISEFDPFASEHSGGPEKPKSTSEPKTPLASKATPQRQGPVPSADIQETPSAARDVTTTIQAPRKQNQKPQNIGSHGENASPSAARQAQTRTGASNTAEQQHQHAGSLLSEGESRTNPKSKEMAFDFQGFLAQLRTRQAEPIQKYLKRSVTGFDTVGERG